MKDIDRQKVENYLLYCGKTALWPESLPIAIVYLGIFSVIALIWGVLLGGVYLALGLIMVLLTFAYIILSVVLMRKLMPSLKISFVCNTIVSVFSAAFSFLLGLLVFFMSNTEPVHLLFLVPFYSIPCCFYWSYMLRVIKRDAFKGKVAKPNLGAQVGAAGGALGMLLVRLFLPGLDQSVGFAVGYGVFFLVSVCFSMGCFNVYNYYLCVKYGVDEVYEIPKPSKKALEAQKRKKRKTILLVILIPIAVFILLVAISIIEKRFFS